MTLLAFGEAHSHTDKNISGYRTNAYSYSPSVEGSFRSFCWLKLLALNERRPLPWPSQKALPRIQQASPFSFRRVEPQSIAGWTHASAYQRRDQVYCNTPSRTQARSISAPVHLGHGKPQLHGLSNVPLSRMNIFRTILSIPGHF